MLIQPDRPAQPPTDVAPPIGPDAGATPSPHVIAAAPDPMPRTGLAFAPAAMIEQATEAWSLVYRAYLESGLIPPNPHRLHTVPHAFQQRSIVICGRIRGLTVSTLSAYFDHPDTGDLPLDRVYGDELAKLREAGRRLMEMGLFADRREHLHRSIEALLELMRYACYFGVVSGGTDGVIGVHPRHAPFYTRMLGFEQVGQQRAHPIVQNHPVVLLRIAWHEMIGQPKLPRGLRYLRDNPLGLDAFANRCPLTIDQIAGTPLEPFVQTTPTA